MRRVDHGAAAMAATVSLSCCPGARPHSAPFLRPGFRPRGRPPRLFDARMLKSSRASFRLRDSWGTHVPCCLPMFVADRERPLSRFLGGCQRSRIQYFYLTRHCKSSSPSPSLETFALAGKEALYSGHHRVQLVAISAK